MLGKNSGQLHLHDVVIYEKMIPKNHLLLKLDDAFDFEFIYELDEDPKLMDAFILCNKFVDQYHILDGLNKKSGI